MLRVCPVCNGEDETIFHALVTCSFASLCWQGVIPGVQQERDGDFYGWLGSIFGSANQDMRATVVTVCWAIRKACNEKNWNKKQMSINGFLALTKQYLVQRREAQGRSTEALSRLFVTGDGVSSW